MGEVENFFGAGWKIFRIFVARSRRLHVSGKDVQCVDNMISGE